MFDTGRDQRAWLRVPALYAVAVAQPILGLIGASPDFLVAHALRPVEVLGFALLVGLAVPVVWALVEGLLARRWPRLARGIRLVATSLLLTALALQVIRGWPLAGGVIVALAMLIAALMVWLIEHRSPPLRSALGVLALSVFVFPIVFLVQPRVAGLLRVPETDITRKVDARIPVVLVVFDELPLASLLEADGGIDGGRFPGFARLASRSTWYRQATTVAPSTTYAVPAILTGRYPREERLAAVSDYPDNLFTWLGGTYRLNVSESITQLCPADLCASDNGTPASRLAGVLGDLRYIYMHLLLPEDLTAGLPEVTANWRDFGVRHTAGDPAEAAPSRLARHDVVGVFARFVERLDRRGTVSLHYLHLNLPHVPWRFMPSGRQYGPVGAPDTPFGVQGEGWTEQPWATVQGLQRHLFQLGYADRLLGELLDGLDASPLADRALVIVTSDHGAAFVPGENRRNPTARTFADILRVPLFVQVPGQREGAVDDRNVETVDIVATIADVLGETPPWPIDGRSVLDSAPAPAIKRFVPIQRHRARKRSAEAPDAGPPDAIELRPEDLDLSEVVARRIELFGRGSWAGVYAVGPRSDLLGTSTEEAGEAVAGPRVVLTEPWSFAAVDRSSWYVPTHVEGRLDFGDDPVRPMKLAVAVNGVVRATTESLEDRWDSRPRFAAIVPEESFEDGANRLEIFEIGEESSDLVRLAGQETPRLRLVLDAEGRPHRISGRGRREIEIDPTGFRVRAHRKGNVFWGRVTRPDGKRIAGFALFVDGGEYARLQVPAEPGGFFDFEVPATLLEPGEAVRVFAFHGAGAAEVVPEIVDERPGPPRRP